MGPLRTFEVGFAVFRRKQSRGRAACSASLRLLRGAARPVPCAARVSWPVAELAALTAFAALGQPRRVGSRGALRALPASPALLGAAEALRPPPTRVFAGTALCWGREGESQASSLQLAAQAGFAVAS